MHTQLDPAFMQTWVDRFREWMASEVLKKLLVATDKAHTVSFASSSRQVACIVWLVRVSQTCLCLQW